MRSQRRAQPVEKCHTVRPERDIGEEVAWIDIRGCQTLVSNQACGLASPPELAVVAVDVIRSAMRVDAAIEDAGVDAGIRQKICCVTESA